MLTEPSMYILGGLVAWRFSWNGVGKVYDLVILVSAMTFATPVDVYQVYFFTLLYNYASLCLV
jgi:hypothetical protein